jgi:putative membrane protein
MTMASDVRLERLSKYLFTAPSWQRSLLILVILGLIIDGASFRVIGKLTFSGTIAFTFPALVAFLLTKPIVDLSGKPMTWNRSGLLALSCTVLSVIITLSSFIASPVLLPFFYAFSLGITFGLRLLVLVAIADYRVTRMLIPAIVQSGTGIVSGAILFSTPFFLYGLFVHLVAALVFIFLIWLIERPLYRAFRIRGLSLINALLAHLTDGSKGLEEFFREIGEEVYVPEATFFFRRPHKNGVIFTVPNVHPGPMGEIGGGNLPKLLHDAFSEEVLVAHGCATHDFNLVSESEIGKIIDAVRRSRDSIQFFNLGSRARRVTMGSVNLLCQKLGDSLLLVGTRSPEKTEDIEYGIGTTIMAEGHQYYPHVAFVDAHNCMSEVSTAILPGTLTATEYLRASMKAMEECRRAPAFPIRIGSSHLRLPFTREQGFGDLGLQVLVIEADGQRTAYVLLDGNNMAPGVREQLIDEILPLVEDAEIMTTDSHVVNTLSGNNPIGRHIPAEQIVPYIKQAVTDALADLAPAEVAAATAECERIVVLGSNRTAQLASTVNAMLVFIAPLSIAVLLLAFLLSLIAYTVMV